MKFTYELDGLGDKLVCGEYVIRPVIFEGVCAGPSTFEDFDNFSLYVKVEGLEDWREDFDTVSEAIAWAITSLCPYREHEACGHNHAK